MATKPTPRYIIKAASAVHAFVYTVTFGRVGSRLGNLPILLLTTLGRESGQRRTTPLVYLRDGQDLVIIASYGGHGQQPAWFWNLEGFPQAHVRIDGLETPVVARRATSEEREHLWPEVLRLWPGYAKYQVRTNRTIPLVILSVIATCDRVSPTQASTK